MMKVTIRDNGTLRRLQRKAARVGNLTVPHKRIAAFLDQWVHKNFDSDGGLLEDGAWEPFVHGGRVTEEGIDTSAKLLRDSGIMYGHFNLMFSQTQAGIGNDIPYAEDHEDGLDFTPQRRMLPRQPEIIEDVIRIYEDYINEQ